MTHSLRGGAIGPGNYLIDVDRGDRFFGSGAIVEVSGLRYAITQSSQSITKAQPSREDHLGKHPWALGVDHLPAAIRGGPSIDNMVFTGTLLPTK